MKTITHNGVPCVEAQVHMLATERHHFNHYPGALNVINKTNEPTLARVGNKIHPVTMTPQHLYITTDEEIKEGDWYLANNEIPIQYISTDPKRDSIREKSRRIISNTNPKLTANCKGCKRIIKGSPHTSLTNCTCVNKIPQSFIEEYCKAGGIDKVIIEYIEPLLTVKEDTVVMFTHTYYNFKVGDTITIRDYAFKTRSSLDLIIGILTRDGYTGSISLMNEHLYKQNLKLDSNNCIIIHPVEETSQNVVTIKVTSKETMSFIEQVATKTNHTPPLYTINNLKFHIQYEEEEMYSQKHIESLCVRAFKSGSFLGTNNIDLMNTKAMKWIEENL